ncbi:MAG: twin-arginine translocase TatA/TatE family subunit, partial [Bacteroidetes bacterium]|nr:twin-arginine translocase TatA/TatE family subunit [Bacteroidota bacterium]
MGTPGPFEIIIIFLVILLIFGAKRIPEIARGLGKGIREFKSATSEITKELTVEEKPSHHIQPPRQSTPVSPSTQPEPKS